MGIILTGNECETQAFPATVATERATVDRRGAILTDMGFRRSFQLPAPISRACMSLSVSKYNNSTTVTAFTSTSQALVSLSDGTGKIIAQIRANKPSGSWSLVLDTYDDAGVFTPILVELLPASATRDSYRVDLKVEFDDATNTVTVSPYIDGVLAVRKVQFNAATAGVGKIAQGYFGRPSAPSYSANFQFYIWDLILSDDSTVGVTLTTLQGSSGGFYSQAEGTYVSISGLGVDPSTGLIFRNVGDKTSWFVTPLLGKDYTGSAIAAFVTTFLAGVASSSLVKGFRPFVRISGTDYYVGPAMAASADLSPFTVSVPVNPATGLGWTGSQLTAGIEFGLEAVA